VILSERIDFRSDKSAGVLERGSRGNEMPVPHQSVQRNYTRWHNLEAKASKLYVARQRGTRTFARTIARLVSKNGWRHIWRPPGEGAGSPTGTRRSRIGIPTESRRRKASLRPGMVTLDRSWLSFRRGTPLNSTSL
jgi:hypothetical protein